MAKDEQAAIDVEYEGLQKMWDEDDLSDTDRKIMWAMHQRAMEACEAKGLTLPQLVNNKVVH